jgi:uncharacterized protein YerC
VGDLSGTHRDEYFDTTDLAMTPPAIIECYAERWNVGTTFAEMRSYPGLETTRGRCAATVLRAEPCLFGLCGVVALPYEQLPEEAQAEPGVERGQGGGDVLRRHHRRAALAVDQLGFCHGRPRRPLC